MHGRIRRVAAALAFALVVYLLGGGGAPRLAATASAVTPAGLLSALEGAALDGRSGELILFGSDDPALPALDPSDLSVALRTRFDEGAPPEQRWPGVTIEFSATNAAALDVFYFGAVRDTHFGSVLFEADRLLKYYGLGNDNRSGVAVPISSSVPGYQSELACLAEQGYAPPTGEAIQWRKWFSPTLTIEVAPDDGSIVFAESRMTLNWAYDSALQHPVVDQCVGRFVDHFNNNYRAFADEQLARGNPALHELVQLGRLVGIAEWLSSRGLLDRLAGLDGRLAAATVTPGATPPSTPRIDVAAGLLVQSGGIELRVAPASFRAAAQTSAAAVSALQARTSLALVDWSPDVCGGAPRGRALAGAPCRAIVYLPRPAPRYHVYAPSLSRP